MIPYRCIARGSVLRGRIVYRAKGWPWTQRSALVESDGVRYVVVRRTLRRRDMRMARSEGGEEVATPTSALQGVREGRQMKMWTTERPKSPGFYWTIDRVVHIRGIVAVMSDGSVFATGNREPVYPGNIELWSVNPLPVPDLPFELAEEREPLKDITGCDV
jgi:hypothetical protein